MWRTRLIRRGADTEQAGSSAGRLRREVYVTSGLGVLLVSGVLGVGTVFAPADGVPVHGAGVGAGGTLRLPDAPASRGAAEDARGGSVVRTVPTDLVASAAPAANGDGPAGGAAAGTAGRAAFGARDGAGERRGDRRQRSDAGIGSGTAAGAGVGTTAGGAPASAGDPGSGTPAATPTQTIAADATQSRVRLRVNTVSVTGTKSGTLQPGAQVRLRMTTATDAATPAPDGAAPVPETLDVRLGLDEKAVARLNAAAADGTAESLALQAKVDLVGADTANATTSSGLSVRVRMRVTSTDTPQTISTRVHDGDGVSNVVEVTAPLGTKDEAKPTTGTPGAPQDGTAAPAPGKAPESTPDQTPAPAPAADAETAPVEVVLPISAAPTPAQGGEGTKVDVPLPDAPTTTPDPATPAADAAGVDVEVHVPSADEPIGGTPVIVADPTTGDPTPTTPQPDPAPTASQPDPTATSPGETPDASGANPETSASAPTTDGDGSSSDPAGGQGADESVSGTQPGTD